jgi:hypothetical protein
MNIFGCAAPHHHELERANLAPSGLRFAPTRKRLLAFF